MPTRTLFLAVRSSCSLAESARSSVQLELDVADEPEAGEATESATSPQRMSEKRLVTHAVVVPRSQSCGISALEVPHTVIRGAAAAGAQSHPQEAI